MSCSDCGFDNPQGMNFCGECGKPLASGCPQCGFESPPGFKFCGAALAGSPPIVAAGFKPASGAIGHGDAGHRPAATGMGSPRAYTPKHLAEKIRTARAALEEAGRLDDAIEASGYVERIASLLH